MGSTERITSATNYKPIGRKNTNNPLWLKKTCPEGCAIPLCRPLRIFQFLTTLLLFALVVYLSLKTGVSSSESTHVLAKAKEKLKSEISRASKSGKHLTHLASILLITLTSSYLFFMAIDIISQFGYDGLPDTPMFLCSFLGMLLFGIAGVLMIYYRDPNDYLTELIMSEVLCFIISALFLIEITMLLVWWRLKCLSWKKCYPYTPEHQRKVNTIFQRDCPCDIITEGNRFDTTTSTSNVKIPLGAGEDSAVEDHGRRKINIAHRREYIDRPCSVPALSSVQMAGMQTDSNRHCVSECQTQRTEFKESTMQTNSRCELCNRLMDNTQPSMQFVVPQTNTPFKHPQQGHCAMCPAFFHMMRGPMASPCCQSCNCGDTTKDQPHKPVPYQLNETPKHEESEIQQEAVHQRPRTTTINSGATRNNSPTPSEKSESELRGSSTSKRAAKISSPNPESGLATITSGLPESESRVTLSSINYTRHKRTQTRGDTEESESSDVKEFEDAPKDYNHGKEQSTANHLGVTFSRISDALISDSNNKTIHDVKNKLISDVELRKKLSEDPRISYVSPTKSAFDIHSSTETPNSSIFNDTSPKPKSTGKILYRADKSDPRVSEPADLTLSWLPDESFTKEETEADWNLDEFTKIALERTDDEIQNIVTDEASNPLESELSAIEEENSDMETSSVKKKASNDFSNKNEQDTNISNAPVLRLRLEESPQDFHNSAQQIQDSEDAVSRISPKNRSASKKLLKINDWTTRERSGIIEEDPTDSYSNFPGEDEQFPENTTEFSEFEDGKRTFSEKDNGNTEPHEFKDTKATLFTTPNLILRSKSASEKIDSSPVLYLRSGKNGDELGDTQRRTAKSDYVSSPPNLKNTFTKGFIDETDSAVSSKSKTLSYELSDDSSVGRIKSGKGISTTPSPTTKAIEYIQQRSGKIESDGIDPHSNFPDEEERLSEAENERKGFYYRNKTENSGEHLISLKRRNEFADVTSSSSLEGAATLKEPSTEAGPTFSSGSMIRKSNEIDSSFEEQRSDNSSRDIRALMNKSNDFFEQRSGKIKRNTTDSFLDFRDENERFSKSENEQQEFSDRHYELGENRVEYLESLKEENEFADANSLSSLEGKATVERPSIRTVQTFSSTSMIRKIDVSDTSFGKQRNNNGSRDIRSPTSKSQFPERSGTVNKIFLQSDHDQSSREIQSERFRNIDKNLSDSYQDFANENNRSREIHSLTSNTSGEFSDRFKNTDRKLSDSYKDFAGQDKSSREIQSVTSKTSALSPERSRNYDRNLFESNKHFSDRDESSREIHSRTSRMSGQISERSRNIESNSSDSDKDFIVLNKTPSDEETSATSSPSTKRSEDGSTLKTDAELAEAIIQEGSGAESEEFASLSRKSRITGNRSRASNTSSTFEPRSSKMSSGFEPRVSKISSKFEPRSSKISSEFEPRASKILSEFEQSTSRISPKIKPRVSKESSDLDRSSSKILSEFKPRDSKLSLEFKTRHSDISSQFKPRDSETSSGIDRRKYKPKKDSRKSGEAEQSRSSKFKAVSSHGIGQIGRDTTEILPNMSARERKISKREASLRSSEFLSKSAIRSSDNAEPYIDEWSSAESKESATPPRLSSAKPSVHKDSNSRTASIYEYEEDDETSDKDSTPYLDLSGELTNITPQQVSSRSEESNTQSEDESTTRFEVNNEQMEKSDVSEFGKKINAISKSKMQSETNADHSSRSDSRKTSDDLMTRQNYTSEASLEKRSSESSEFVQSSRKIDGAIHESYSGFPGGQKTLSDQRPSKRLRESDEIPEKAEQVESEAKMINLGASESKVFSPSRQLSRTKEKIDKNVERMKDSIDEVTDQSRRVTEESPVDRHLQSLQKRSSTTSGQSTEEFMYVPAPWSLDGNILQRKSKIESVDQRRKSSTVVPVNDSHDVPPNGSSVTQCITNEGCPTFEMRVGGVTSICTDDSACAEPCSCRIKSILLDQCSEHPHRDTVRLSSQELYSTGLNSPRNSTGSKSFPWKYRRNENSPDCCLARSRETCRNDSQPKRLIMDHFCHVS